MKLKEVVILLVVMAFCGGPVGCGHKAPPTPPPESVY